MDENDTSILDDDTIQPNISELEQRIYALELRNRDLENRNCQLTKICTVLSMFEIEPNAKIKRVNNCAKINKEIQDLVDHWSRCLTLEDFIHGSHQLDNGYRNRPVFSPEDFMTIYNAATGLVDAKSLQKLCRMFSRTLTPYLCQQFLYLKGETRHPDILTSYLSAILTLHLFALHHSE